MRRILQGDSTGCGLACIAMLADCSYKKVKKKAVQKLNFSNKRKLYTGTRHLKILGKCFGINIAGSRRRPFKNWDALPDTAIISINPNLNHTSWHWVVFSRTNGASFVLDPKQSIKSNKRTDFGRMRPSGYLPVRFNK